MLVEIILAFRFGIHDAYVELNLNLSKLPGGPPQVSYFFVTFQDR